MVECPRAVELDSVSFLNSKVRGRSGSEVREISIPSCAWLLEGGANECPGAAELDSEAVKVVVGAPSHLPIPSFICQWPAFLCLCVCMYCGGEKEASRSRWGCGRPSVLPTRRICQSFPLRTSVCLIVLASIAQVRGEVVRGGSGEVEVRCRGRDVRDRGKGTGAVEVCCRGRFRGCDVDSEAANGGRVRTK